MGKLKNPMLGLGAVGTIGDAITYQKHKTSDVVRAKPVPFQPHTLAQTYQRWDYQDYVAWWLTLTIAQKQVYKSEAARHHRTGLAQFLKQHLGPLTALHARWRLDELGGITAYDSSRNDNHGVIIGTIPIEGVIDYARLFDGLNDTIRIPYHSSLSPIPIVLIEAFVLFKGIAGAQWIVSKYDSVLGKTAFVLQKPADNFLYFSTGTIAGVNAAKSLAIVTTDTWYHVVGYHDGTDTRLFVNGVPQTDAAIPLPPELETYPVYLGSLVEIGLWFDGYLDNVILSSHILTDAQIIQHSERRYPLE